MFSSVLDFDEGAWTFSQDAIRTRGLTKSLRNVVHATPRDHEFRVESPLFQHSRECSGAIRDLVGPQMQLPPRGGTWVCSTCNILTFIVIQVLPSEWLLISVKFQSIFLLFNKCGAASSRITESDTPPLKKVINVGTKT
ncbi:hypothetical protein HZH66_013043 [Vespula vulgaris]|uniref:Uncharacterized protein n=1 Tax=Vespula vulgaris TaxID=7454 RepID=A0A834J628_VESVU|nr:hypothetical protein HZH66_013043 [Vespula vulgaris]